MVEPWILATLLYSVIGTAYVMSNDFFKLDGDVAVFWRSVFGALFMLPFVAFMEWPEHNLYYWFVLISGLAAAISDIIMFQAFKKHGGAAVSRMMGFRPIFLFAAWPFFHPAGLSIFVQAPLVSAGIVLCLLLTSMAFVFTRRSPHAYAAFMAFLPCLLLLTICDIFQKFSAHEARGFSGMIIITFLYCLIMAATSGGWMLIKDKKISRPDRNFVLSGSINGVLFVLLVVVKTFALNWTSNPAFFSALSLVFVLWAFLVHRYVFKKEDNASPIAGFVVVAAAAVLTILVEMLPK